MAAMFVAATTMMVACNSGDDEGFTKTDNGLYYRFDKQNPDGQQVQEGDVLVGELTIRFDTVELFSNKGQARRIAQAIPNFEIKIGGGGTGSTALLKTPILISSKHETKRSANSVTVPRPSPLRSSAPAAGFPANGRELRSAVFRKNWRRSTRTSKRRWKSA